MAVATAAFADPGVARRRAHVSDADAVVFLPQAVGTWAHRPETAGD